MPTQSDSDSGSDNYEDSVHDIYSNLPLRDRQFRLLRVCPGSFGEAVYSELFVSELDGGIVKYEPLSYVWGTAENLQRIYINGHTFYVTINLESALRHLRHPKKERILWADAVCINQLDDLERGRQVMLMSDIYSNCHSVAIWLGQELETSDSLDEPGFLREPSATQSVYLILTPDPVTGETYKYFYERGSVEEQIGNPQSTVLPPLPFVDFTYEDDADRAVQQVENFVWAAEGCVQHDDWHYQGRNNDNTLFALCFLHLLARDEHPGTSFLWHDFRHRRNILRILSRITRRPWWTRIWIVQEVLLPPSAVIYIGHFSIPWKTFSQAVKNFIRHRQSCCSGALSEKPNHEMDVLSYMCSRVENIEGMREQYSSRKLNLLSTLWHTRSRNSTEPRDKVYGILGVAREQSISVRYSISILDLYRDVVFSIVQREGNYSILSGITNKQHYPNLPAFIENPPRLQSTFLPDPEENDYHADEHPELYPLAGLSRYAAEHTRVWPTWLPDFACPSSPFEHERLSLLSLYNASNGIKPPHIDPNNGIAAAGGFQIQSICVDVVTDVGNAMFIPRNSSHNPELRQWHSIVQKRYRSVLQYYNGQPGYQCYPNGDTWQDAYWRTLCADVLPEDSQDNHSEQSHRKFRRTRPSDRAAFDSWYPNPTSGPGTHGEDGVGFMSLGPRDPDLGREHDNTVGASVKANTFLRRIFITDHSYMGLGPPNLQPGDEIHVLLGGRTPFVLRPVHAIEGPVPFFLYMLVGDCYLHGFMDGEAFIKCTVSNEGNVFMTKAAQKKLQKFPHIGFWLLHAVQLHTSFCLFTAEGEMPLRSLV